MPKTLAEESPDGRVFFAPGILRHSPFASDVAYVIALWAHIDGDIASILSRMLKSDIAVGTAMYLSLVGAGAQRGALDAAAQERDESRKVKRSRGATTTTRFTGLAQGHSEFDRTVARLTGDGRPRLAKNGLGTLSLRARGSRGLSHRL